jgi:hypothetical protein
MEDNARSKCNLLNLEAAHIKKLFLIIIIVFFCLVIYLSFVPYAFNIQRGKISIVKPSPPSIGGFYHFSTIGKYWRNIVNEQMLLAHLSGIIDASSNIYVTGLGKIDDNITIYDIFSDPKFIYEYDTKTDRYEFPTLKKLEKFCLDNNHSLVWYAHSKGASHDHNNMDSWRGVMNYFVLEKWQHCHGLLTSTNYTTCGAILTFDSVRERGWNTYYAGNMWWAKCSHVNQLKRIEKIDQKDRYMAELYVTSEPDIGHFNCFYLDLRSTIQFNKQNASCTINYPLWKVR